MMKCVKINLERSDNMIDKLKDFMQKKFNYKLIEYKICIPEGKKKKTALFPLYLFIVVLIGYAIQQFGLIDDIYNIWVVIIVGILLMMYQITLIQKNKPESLVVTAEYLIKCFGKKTFVVVKYDDIKRFKVNEKEGLIVSDRNNQITISPVCYQEDLEPIVDILEAKGKTFDKTREYMKRPVIIRIINNKIIIKEIKQEESSTEKLVGEYLDDYKMLTPGFIKDVLFLNSVVEEAHSSNNNLIIKLNKFEVKEGHPENIGFESIMATDGIIIFEDIKIKFINIRKARERNAVEELLPNEVESIVDNIEKGVITNWKYRKNGIDLHFAAGTNILKVSFDYKEVIIGWNIFK